MSDAYLAATIAEFVCALDGKAIEGQVIERLKLATLDCLAAALGGVAEPVSRHTVNHVASSTTHGVATIIGHGVRSSCEGAALANGTLAHAADYDDSSLTMWGHSTAPVLPAVLAVAEASHLSGLEFLIGLAAGLEVETTLGGAAGPGHFEAGWQCTSTLGVLGAAVATAKVLALDRAGVQNALGVAASRASGLRQNVGTMVKPLQVGFAARDGVEAAMLARSGVVASTEALDGPLGFFQLFAPAHRSLETVAQRLGNPFEVVDPGLSFKLYPSCGDTHAAVDAILALRRERNLQWTDVRHVRCGVTPLTAKGPSFHCPTNPVEAKFSLEYCIAVAMQKGRLGLHEFDPHLLADPDVRALMQRISVEVHPDLSDSESLSFCAPAIIEVEMTDGRKFARTVTTMRGHPRNPLTRDDLETKFSACAEQVLPEASARRAINMINALETVPDISALLHILGR